jgi:hypothetical protein
MFLFYRGKRDGNREKGESEMIISKENAQALWRWKGSEEFAEAKKNIKDAKKRLQRISNRVASGKGSMEMQLRSIKIISHDLLQEIDYLKRVGYIKSTADL